MGKYLIVFLLSLVSISLAAQKDWELQKEKHGIKVYTRKVEGYKLKEVKAVTNLQTDIQSVVNVIIDLNNHKNWVNNCEVSEIIEDSEENEWLYYNTFSTPWPAKDRDAVTHVVVEKNEATEALIRFKAIPGHLEDKDGFVRVPYSKGSWDLVQKEDNLAELTYQIHVDSGGSIPKWMVNELIIKTPLKTIRNLKEMFEVK